MKRIVSAMDDRWNQPGAAYSPLLAVATIDEDLDQFAKRSLG